MLGRDEMQVNEQPQIAGSSPDQRANRTSQAMVRKKSGYPTYQELAPDGAMRFYDNTISILEGGAEAPAA
jgi:hypothetical protein